MPQTLLKNSCVKISLFAEGDLVNMGTGVIVGHGDKHFILTAEHCIHGEKGEFIDIPFDQITAEYQQSYDTEFLKIKLIKKTSYDKSSDWALLEIEKPEIEFDFSQIQIGTNFLSDEPVHFRGYQAAHPKEPRTWKATIIDDSSTEFKITLSEKSFEQGGEMGLKMAKGLSGSGVYIIRGNKLYLIGHLKQVLGNVALNDDIKCCKIVNLGHPFSNIVDLSDIQEIDLWQKASELKITDEDVKNWVEQNDDHFKRLLRKCRVITNNETKAEEIAHKRITDYLDQSYINHELSTMSSVISQYESTAVVFEDSVKEAYSRTVTDSSAAKDLLLRLQSDFAEHIKELVNDNSNKVNMQLARHKVTWWLMNCSFNFED